MALCKLKYISLIFASILCSATVTLSEQTTLSAFQSFEEVQRATEKWTQAELDKTLSAQCEVSSNFYTCYSLSGIAVLKYYALRDYESARRYLEIYRKFAIKRRGAPCIEEGFYISGDGNAVYFSYWAALYAIDKAQQRDPKRSGVYAYSCQLLDDSDIRTPNLDDEKLDATNFEKFMQTSYGNLGGQQAFSFNSEILQTIWLSRYELMQKYDEGLFSDDKKMKLNASLYQLYRNAYKKCRNDEYLDDLCSPLKEFSEIYYRVAAGVVTGGRTE